MLTLLIASAYCLFTLVRFSWDPMAFVRVGQQFDPVHGVAGMGYDGQFAYQIARNPGGAAPLLDVPAYRYQRIFYPLLARWLALGYPNAIPWTLIFVNLGSLTLGVLATEKLLAAHGRSRWYALAYGLFGGFLISVRMDLTEPLAYALVQWGVYYFDQKRSGFSLLLFILASLTRELALLFAAGCVLSMFADRQWRRGFVWGMAAVLPFGLWQVYLRFWLGSWGVSSGGAFASSFELIPFRGWWEMIYTQELQLFIVLSLIVLLVALIPASMAIIASLRALSRRKYGLGVWLLLLNALIFPFLPSSNVLHLPGLLRVTAGLVAAVLDYGALKSSWQALQYSQLWLLLLVFGEGLI